MHYKNAMKLQSKGAIVTIVYEGKRAFSCCMTWVLIQVSVVYMWKDHYVHLHMNNSVKWKHYFTWRHKGYFS